MKYQVPHDLPALLDVLGWSTSQGDAAVEGANAAIGGAHVGDCPYVQPSSLAYPWTSGWIATSAAGMAPPSFSRGQRGGGHLDLVLKANGSAASLAVTVHASSSAT